MSRDLLHGGALDAMRVAFPGAREPWIDLSTGINPWPYPGAIVSREAFAHLPTRTAGDACRAAMAAAIGAPEKSLLLTPGSEIAIRLLPDVIRPQRIAILSPTYSDHAAAWRRAGAETIETEDPLGMARSVNAVVVTHPNNPDGRLFDVEALEAVRRDLAERDGWLIVDEAYADLMPEQSLAPKGGAEGLIILRSFGKFFGLAGVRLGAVMAPPSVLRALTGRLGTWPVSGPALEIGTQAYLDTAWQRQMRKTLSSATARLNHILASKGMKPIGGTDLYRYVEVANAYSVFEQLAKAGIYVRRFEWSQAHLRFGLPETTEAENRLKAALTP
ncbi:MAG: threonine-phosphate decarboxylase CobD [Henriciella sp.]